MLDILDLTLLQPPFILGSESSVVDTNVTDEIILETPTLLISGTFYNQVTGISEEYNSTEIQHDTIKQGNTFFSKSPKIFIGPITISFSSKYPLKTYPNITRTRNQFIGEPKFGYQSNRAEIRYSVGGNGSVHNKSTLYKRPIILKHNTSGSDNILLNYKIFYKGKTSAVGSAYISIKKTDDKFYSFNENG